MDDQLRRRRRELFASTRHLQGDGYEPEHVELERVAQWCRGNGIERDLYGTGDDLQAFEDRVAGMLGQPAARFMPSGTMAQQIACRVWCERRGIARIGMHPTCHMELHEERGYRRLHGLDVVLVGSFETPMSSADLSEVPETMSALVVELPTRENGGRLAPWDDLGELCDLAEQRGIARHLDGARLWEAAAGYDRPLDEIAGRFDSVYVSFYKGIGALSGAMLAGPEEVIQAATAWQRRHGGNLFSATANWASAAMRLEGRLDKMASHRRRAIEIASVLSSVEGLQLKPAVPQVNMFHVYISGDAERLAAARDAVADEQDLWLFGGLQSTAVPDVHRFELTIGDAALSLDDDEIASAFERLVDTAVSPGA